MSTNVYLLKTLFLQHKGTPGLEKVKIMINWVLILRESKAKTTYKLSNNMVSYNDILTVKPTDIMTKRLFEKFLTRYKYHLDNNALAQLYLPQILGYIDNSKDKSNPTISYTPQAHDPLLPVASSSGFATDILSPPLGAPKTQVVICSSSNPAFPANPLASAQPALNPSLPSSFLADATAQVSHLPPGSFTLFTRVSVDVSDKDNESKAGSGTTWTIGPYATIKISSLPPPGSSTIFAPPNLPLLSSDFPMRLK